MVGVLFGVVFVSLLGGLTLGLFLRMRRSTARIVAELRDAHGSDLKYVSGCGVVSGRNRVPGVLALFGDRLEYRPLIFLNAGEIPLQGIVEFHSEETRNTRYGRARKYWNARVFAFRNDAGEEKIFVVRKARAKEWEAALERAGIRPRAR
jgi:hypothetical protein